MENEVFEEGSSATFVFEPSGNNPADNQNIGQANYTSQMVNNETSKSAKLFWNGDYTFNHIDIKELQGAKSKADLKQEIINYLIKDSPDKI